MKKRCRIVDAGAAGHTIGPYKARTPTKSVPHIGKKGWAEPDGKTVTITLDDGTILKGYQCWWEEIRELKDV